MFSDISHFGIPEGPNGPTSPYFVAFSHALMKYAKGQKAAKEFLKRVQWSEGEPRRSTRRKEKAAIC